MTKTINVMAPLVVGDPNDLHSEKSRQAWQEFAKQLAAVKASGADAVSTDVWWGLVEKSERRYDWPLYDMLSDYIIAAGLMWVPIISLHQCGGNIGDTVTVKLPEWLWTKLAAKTPSGKVDAVRYVSEQGNASLEYVSCWATDLVIDDYKAFFGEFQSHFASKAAHIAEINISLGPAGELRYPSYNSHDKNTDYPTRGALQCYSELARQSFIDAVLLKYGSVEDARKAWGVLEFIEPPRNVQSFFDMRVHVNTQYGRDFFDWYSGSLMTHGRKVINAALDIFSSIGAAFAGIDLGAKVPGVHWRMGHWEGDKIVLSDRLAELNAGLIRTREWDKDDTGHGYRHIVTMFHDLQSAKPGTRVVLHFTCLEMADGENESLALQLTRWVGSEACRQGVPIKGENALNFTLYDEKAWDRLRAALGVTNSDNGFYDGLTILRMSDVVTNVIAAAEFNKTLQLLSGEGVSVDPMPKAA